MSAVAFVYIAPARFEDILKIGFSHDPCNRVRSFHPRWFEYFDLHRGLAIGATDEKDARRIERLFAEALRDHRARAPLVIERAAGGFTEWYRGALARIHALVAQIVTADGYAPPASFAATMHARLLQERDDLFERCSALLDAIEALRGEPEASALENSLRCMLDAYTSFRIDVRDFLPASAIAWREQDSPD